MDFSVWTAFCAASIVLAMAPGPDNLFVLSQSAIYGPRSGIIVVLGLCSGLVIQTLCAACGIAAVVAAIPALFFAIKLAGALYLFYLAYKAWVHAKDEITSGSGTKKTGLMLWRRGLIMNITNPKVQIFFLAFFPQFVAKDTQGIDLVLQMVIQGITFIAATLLVFSAVAFCAGALASKVKSPAFRFYLNRLSALLFVVLALSTLFLG